MIYTAQHLAAHLTERGATVTLAPGDTPAATVLRARCGGRTVEAVFAPRFRHASTGEGATLRTLRAVVDALALPYVVLWFRVSDSYGVGWRVYVVPVRYVSEPLTELEADECAIDWRTTPRGTMPAFAA